MLIEVGNCLSKETHEFRFQFSEGEMPRAVEIRHSIQFDTPEWLAIVFAVPRGDSPIQPAIVALGLASRVINAAPDGRELDWTSHHLSGAILEPAKEFENNTAIVCVFEAVALWVIAVVEVARVHTVFTEVCVRLTRMAGTAASVVEYCLHPMPKPARKRKSRNDAANLVLWVVGVVVTVRGVMSVG
jgi:hypothetical protein